MIFDTENPTGGDTDLGTPNNTFDTDGNPFPSGGTQGPGIGSGGEIGKPGENRFQRGNALITSQDNNPNDPNDLAGAVDFTFTFDSPVIFDYIDILDNDELGSCIVLYDEFDNELRCLRIGKYGSNSYQRVIGKTFNVKKLVVELPGSGAITELCYTRCRSILKKKLYNAISLGRNWTYGASTSAGNKGLTLQLTTSNKNLVKFIRDPGLALCGGDYICEVIIVMYMTNTNRSEIKLIIEECNFGDNNPHEITRKTINATGGTDSGDCPMILRYKFDPKLLINRDVVQLKLKSNRTTNIGIWQVIVR
jgi:hypothetical protein